MQLAASYSQLRGRACLAPDSPAQVEGKEALRKEALLPQAVKDGRGSLKAKAGIAQSQDAIKDCVFHELAWLLQAQAECLGYVRQAPDLWERRRSPHKGLEAG